VLVMGGIICSVLFLFFCLVHLASLGYRLQPEFSSRSRSRCSEGGFGLWLGDEGIVVVKRAHNPLYSNRLWAHTPFSQPKTLEGNITARY
jgi:hypothetical protein